jgi:lipopolysaccharide export system ATP-binding protein
MGYLSQEPSMLHADDGGAEPAGDPGDAAALARRATQAAAGLLDQFGLKHKAKHQARTCSGGERRKLEIARALVTSPKLILLDEPFSGVDPIAVEDLQTEIRRLAETGIAFLITDHNVQQTLRVCDRAYILDSGKVFAEGTPRDLINDEMVRRVYLGSLFRGDEFDDHHAPRGAGNSANGQQAMPLVAAPTTMPRTAPNTTAANGQPAAAVKPAGPRGSVNPPAPGASGVNPPGPRR